MTAPADAGVKHDAGKPRWDLLPWEAVEAVVLVLTYGATKYGPDNWRRVPGARWRYLGAALRHVAAWARGQRLDAESGLPHLAHAAASILFLISLDAAPPAPRRWRHRETGGVYTQEAIGRLQIADVRHDDREVVVYRGEDGAVWVRPVAEFYERFDAVDGDAG